MKGHSSFGSRLKSLLCHLQALSSGKSPGLYVPPETLILPRAVAKAVGELRLNKGRVTSRVQ